MAVGALQPTVYVSDELLQDAISGVKLFTESARGWADAFYGRPAEILSIGTEYWTCWHCGGKTYTDYTCTQCGAPTEQWWARLDRMIAKWKRGGRWQNT